MIIIMIVMLEKRKCMRKDEKGFSGLEAAIVLIAFVVVAAVFSYVMLGAGFFTTQKSKQVVDTSVDQAASSMTMDGQYVILKPNETGHDGTVANISIYVTQSAGGQAIDLNETTVALKTEDGYKQVTYNDSTADNFTFNTWSWTCVQGDDDNVLEVQEKYKILLNLSDSGWLPAAGNGTLPGTNDQLTVEIKPPVGAPLTINKQVPPSLTTITYV